jgi:uncharacterized membrane protein YphA (DoxX/SURF4 family)
MPLRLFLGVTFLYAGLQKLSNPDFFNSASATSIHAQMEGAIHTSPVHGLLSLLLPVASAVGLVIALGEVAVGVGALLGLFTRIAALGGVLLSLGPNARAKQGTHAAALARGVTSGGTHGANVLEGHAGRGRRAAAADPASEESGHPARRGLAG